MRNCLSSRRFLMIVFAALLILVGTLSIVYAALSTTLQIIGNAEVTAASWDIYLDNVQLNSSSATVAVPTITDKTTASFSTTLTNPGDFYEFTIDVVNNGSIDAMIDSVTKIPELSDTQKKYLNYIVEYQSGEAISTKHLVSKDSFVRLKVRVEFRKDISVSDLPTQSETLNLAFTVNYIQADETGTNVEDNGVKKSLDIISGDLETVGSEVAIGDEHFYIISNTDGKVAMLAKYNLYVGNVYNGSTLETFGDEATGRQDSTMLGYIVGQTVRNGTTIFSGTNYWDSDGLKAEYGTSYPAYVYDSNSTLYNYVENYRIYLQSQGVEVEEARLIKAEELETLGCSVNDERCTNAPSWVYATTYWSGTASSNSEMWHVISNGYFFDNVPFNTASGDGVRPVIVINI